MNHVTARRRTERARRRVPRALRPYLPNTSARLALVSLDDPEPFRAYWPMRFTQLVGGRRWSLSVVRYQTPAPVRADEGLLGADHENRRKGYRFEL